jgi:hypothetical protein
MACERYVGALADAAAGAPASAELEAHLAACAGCLESLRAQRQALVHVDLELTDLLRTAAPPALPARIRLAVADGARAEGWWRGSRARLAGAVAAVCVVVLLAQLRFVPPPEPPGARPVAENPRPAEAERGALGPGSAEAGSGAETTRPAGARSESRPASDGAARPARRERVLARPSGSPPEIIVPGGELEALLRLASVLREEHVDATELVARLEDSSSPLQEPAPIQIRPLEIARLEAATPPGI